MPSDRPAIALVGIGCRLPGDAHGPTAAWRMLTAGTDAVKTVPPDRWDALAWWSEDPDAPGKSIAKKGGFLNSIARFDAARFGISPREALQMDPQQRMLLEVAWEAFEDAGMAPDQLAGSRTGLYVGMGLSDYGRRTFLGDNAEKIDAYAGTGSFSSVAAGRVSYALGLEGPALAIHTACSSSLVSVHLAMQALRAGEIDVALAGGVSLMLAPEPSVYFSKLGALSADGRCRTFDASASGYGRGEGCGLVVLKRLSAARADGDRVFAVLRGSAINQDGRSNGLTAPSGRAQQRVIRAALADAGIDAKQVGYVEAHGTGTPLGDPIEMAALTAVYGAGDQPCAVGSIKTNIGHLEAAAGVAALIKTALALHHKQIPAHLHLKQLNPRIDLAGTRLHIATEHGPWTGPLRAGVSAFGLSGTNAHIVLDAAAPPPKITTSRPRAELLLLSAGSPEHLDTLRPSVASALRDVNLRDACWSWSTGRALLEHRIAVVASDAGEAAALLASGEGQRGSGRTLPSVVFAYTGQGAQWHRMAESLYANEHVFRDAVDQVDALLQTHRDGSLVEVLYGDDPELVHHTHWTQPALFAVAWGLTALWRSWGVTPDAVLGHSIGEIVAATTAGLFSLEDAVALVAERARLMGELPEGGAMAAVRADLPTVKAAIAGREDLAIAGVNSPQQIVISGAERSVNEVCAELEAAGIKSKTLQVSHAFHSPLVEPILDRFERVAVAVGFRELALPLFSNLTGKQAGPEIRSGVYWRQHVRKPVRFAQGLQSAWDAGHTLFIEIGPQPVLSAMGARTLPQSTWLPSLRRDADARSSLLETLGALAIRGLRPKVEGLYPAPRPQRVNLPPTPFEGEHYWLAPPQRTQTVDAAPVYGVHWDRVPGVANRPTGRWFVSGEDTVVTALCQALTDAGVPVEQGLPATWGPDQHVLLAIPEVDDAARAWNTGPEQIRRAWVSALGTGARLYVTTRNAAGIHHAECSPTSGFVWGLSRVLSVEGPDTWGSTVDLDRGPVDGTALLDALGYGETGVVLRSNGVWVPRLVPRNSHRPVSIRADATYLITGGLGALGQQVARWLAKRGAKHLVLATRSGAHTPEHQALLRRLADDAVSVHCPQIDVSDAAAVSALVTSLEAPLAGVIHAAGSVHVEATSTVDAQAFATGFSAKVLGALALDAATVDLDLDFFVLFSSISAMWGSAGLGGYAATNAFLDALAVRRRAQDLPGLSVAWGPWQGAGLVSVEEQRQFARMGLRPLAAKSALGALDNLLGSGPHRIIADVDWDILRPVLSLRRPRPFLDRVAPQPRRTPVPAARRADASQLKSAISGHVAAILGLPSGSQLDPDRGFFDLGMDSLMAVELHRRLQDRLGLDLPATAAFDHPSVNALVRAVSGEKPVVAAAPVAVAREPIAIVGWSCRFPGANSPEAFEQLLFSGRDVVTAGSARSGCEHGGFLPNIEDFDAEFFHMPPAEATALDPQQRLLLEVSHEALQRSGLAPKGLAGSNTGVFIGIAGSGYWDRLKRPDSEQVAQVWPWSGAGNESAFAAGRLAWTLDLHGPTLSVNTACSSSLVAMHLAVQALRKGECGVALAGGVNLLLSPDETAWLNQIGALSPTGRCRSFDAGADGYVRSEGCGVVVLMPLSQAQSRGLDVLGLIEGSAVGHGGAAAGITVPNGPAQQRVMRAALEDAGVSASEVGYLEAHGTGTALGDPIEVGAIRAVYGQRSEPLQLGAVKSQIGHTETAAGVAGVLKTLLVLKRQSVPATLHLKTPNPKLPLDFPVHIATETTAVTDLDLAAVSSFGIAGTNAHLVLRRGPVAKVPVHDAHGVGLIALSAHNQPALDAQIAQLVASQASVRSMARSLAQSRSPRAVRQVWIGDDLSALSTGPGQVLAAGEAPRVALVFTGQGSQHPDMARGLAEQLPGFAKHFERASAAVNAHLDRPLASIWSSEEVHNTRYTQPALFAIEWALAQTFIDLGVRPVALLGHSIGEWSAAAVAGVLSLEDAALAVVARGAAMADQPGGGAMIALRAPEESVEQALSLYPGVGIAAVNGPLDVVISGDADAVQDLADSLSADGFPHRQLTVSHAFHSAHIAGAMPRFAEVLTGLSLSRATTPVISNVDGQPLGDRAKSPTYWTTQALTAVRFHDGLKALEALGVNTLLEIGPRPALLALAGRADAPFALIPTLQPKQDALKSVLGGLGSLWKAGASLQLEDLFGPQARAIVPTTQWQRSRYWIDSEHAPRSVRPAPRWTADWVEVAPIPGDARVVSLPEDAREALISALESVGDHQMSQGRLVFRASGLAAQAIRGLVAVLAIERPDLRCMITEVPTHDAHAIDLSAVLGCDEPVLRWQNDQWFGERWTQTTVTAQTPQLDGTWMVTGARGALGQRVARWLADCGATQLLLLSRGAPSQAMIEALSDVDARWIQADVADAQAVQDALMISSVQGAVHCAGVQRAGWVADIDEAQINEIWRGKVQGAQVLAELLPESARLLLFGSCTSTLGLPGQACYAAANAVLRGIALQRTGTTHIGWGPWQAGMAADHGWHQTGVQPLSDAEALAGLGAVLADGSLRSVDLIRLDIPQFTAHRGPLTVLGGSPASALSNALEGTAPGARLALVESWTVEVLSGILGHEVDAHTGFFDAGLDSLGAVELGRRLGKRLSIAVSATAAFDHATPAALAKALLERLSPEEAAPSSKAVSHGGDIAIIGLDCQFAGAATPEAFWQLLISGQHAITEVPEARWDIDDWYAPQPSPPGKMYARHGGFLRDIDQFDPDFFGLSPREATGIDPQQRLLLNSAWRALDHAGRAGSAEGSKTAVYVGIAERGWLRRFEGDVLYRDAWAGTGSESSFAAGRISHALGLKGPAIALNTTCSSSLVALHLAVQALQRGEVDQALAGGVHLMLDPQDSAYLSQLGALSPTGRCHSFDAAADGYVRGEGVGMLLLKPLDQAQRDGDRVLAVIKATATNHDGHASGLTVPNGAAQQQVMRNALDASGLSANDIGYLQAHGTGTPLGDPIEIRAVQAVYGPRNTPLVVGTAKTLIGHTELASGAAGLIAAILALQHKTLPLHPLKKVNPDLPMDGLLLPESTGPWQSVGPRRAAVSAFGLSGTNAHIILEEAPERVDPPVPAQSWRLLPIAGSHPDAAVWRRYQPLSTSVLATSLPARAHLRYRSAVVTRKEQLVPAEFVSLSRAGRVPQAAFLFTGQGAQYGGMHRDWLAFPVFRRVLNEVCEAVSQHLDEDLYAQLDDGEALRHTRLTQPALFAIGVALAAQWRAWGVEPVAVSGHSIGELTAAHVAGCLSLDDAAKLVVVRGALMNALPTGGAMAAVLASESDVREFLGDDVDIAGVNHAAETVISGSNQAVEQVLAVAEAQGLTIRRLQVSHAFHSRLLTPMLDEWTQAVAAVKWHNPTLPLVSNLTGKTASKQLADPQFWRKHARDPVRFADGIQTLRQLGANAFIECGPHPVLLGMGRQTLEDAADLLWLPSGRRKTDNAQTLLQSLGDWWVAGGFVDFKAVNPGPAQPLPPYPFRSRRFWPENDRYQRAAWTYEVHWRPGQVGAPADMAGWIVLGKSALATDLRGQLSATGVLEDLDGKGIVDLRALDGDHALALVLGARQLALAVQSSSDSRVWWVTSGGAEHAALVGWARALYAEQPLLRGGTVEVDGHCTGEELRNVLGNDAIRLQQGQVSRPVLRRVSVSGACSLDGTWLITGGLGGLGEHVARWLVSKGVRSLLLTATTALPARESWPEQTGDVARQCALVTDLESAGCTVQLGAFDIADATALADFLGDTQLSGAMHLAGRTIPQSVQDSTPDDIRATLHGKIGGARGLDQWLRAHAPEAKFVLFGSIGGVWGSGTLSAYGAANAYVDAVAHQRRSDGLHGLALDWGPWGGGGMVDDARAEQLARLGQHLLSPTKALRVLDGALSSDLTQVVAARVDWSRFCTLVEAASPLSLFDDLRPKAVHTVEDPVSEGVSAPVRSEEQQRAWVVDTVTRQARAVLRLDADAILDPQQPLMELGFDSLMATELNQILLKEGIALPVGRLLGGPSIDELVVMALARMAPVVAPVSAEVSPVEDDVPAQLLWFLAAAFMLGAAVATAAGYAWAQLRF